MNKNIGIINPHSNIQEITSKPQENTTIVGLMRGKKIIETLELRGADGVISKKKYKKLKIRFRP